MITGTAERVRSALQTSVPRGAAYAPLLARVPIFEVEGRTDFASLVDFVEGLV